jgi:hypothetical protein
VRSADIEEWALRVLARLEGGGAIEDARVELKGGWIDPSKAARRLAGHANAALGEPVLWIVGVSEFGKPIKHEQMDQAQWCAQVHSHLLPPFPEIRSVTTIWQERPVVALFIDTSRAPYVYRNPVYGSADGGPVEFEVPWRSMTAVRSARHEDLVRMLVPRSKAPFLEVLKVHLHILGPPNPAQGKYAPPSAGDKNRWHLDATLYFVPREGRPVVLAGHKHSIVLHDPVLGEIPFRALRHGKQFLVDVGDIVVDLPVRVEITSSTETSDVRELTPGATLHFGFTVAGDSVRVSATCELSEERSWVLGCSEGTAQAVSP